MCWVLELHVIVNVLLHLDCQLKSDGSVSMSLVHLSMEIDVLLSLVIKSLYICDQSFLDLSDCHFEKKRRTVTVVISEVDVFLYNILLLLKLNQLFKKSVGLDEKVIITKLKTGFLSDFLGIHGSHRIAMLQTYDDLVEYELAV